ncbi:MAG: EAL domain-containing protein [Spirochaetaceae bacterium]|nr:MAG: EAL domain-containing protein [Spirochaetaceae bacterium]
MQNRYEYIVNLSHDYITLIDRRHRYELVNDSYCKTIGRAREEILNRSVASVWGGEKFQTTIKPHLDRCFNGEEIHYVDTFEFGENRRHMHVSFYPYSDDGSVITHALVFSHDITRLGETESRLAEYESRDPLTGLLNRRSLDIILRTEIEHARRTSNHDMRAVLFVSLKNFKRVNQTHGHNIGDLLLESTVNRIKEHIRSSDYLCRFEGANLVVILTRISFSTDAGLVAQKLLDTISVPYRFRTVDVTIDCRIGISVFPDDTNDADRLIQCANSASVEAEELGQGFLYYDRGLHQRTLTRLQLHSELLRSFEEHQLELYYQPIVRQHGAEALVAGAEALIRWRHPERGLIGPPDFIDLAEETGVVKAIDKWALYKVCERLNQWPAIFVTMNISASQFGDQELVPVVEAALRHAGNPDPARLKLEITERHCMENPSAAIAVIEQLQELGIEVWIDDFGIGNSSLAYLKNLPTRTFKVAREFAADLADSEQDRRFLRGIIDGIRARHREVVIEGIVDPRQAAVAAEMGCTLMQGFHFGVPMPAADFAVLLDTASQRKQAPSE